MSNEQKRKAFIREAHKAGKILFDSGYGLYAFTREEWDKIVKWAKAQKYIKAYEDQ